MLGGTFADLPYAQRVKLPRNSLRFDPAMGLFGLVPVRAGEALDQPDVRRLLSRSIDRDALIDALNVPGLAARATVLEPALEGVPDPQPVAWAATPLAQRRPALIAEAQRLFGKTDRPTLRILLPQGPGADLLLNRLAADWGALGFKVERAASRASADLELIDAVAPSTSPAWFLRRFRCEFVPVCDPEADTLLDGARNALVPAQRAALARPGGRPHRRRPIVHSDHGAGALVAGVEPHPGLRREPLRPSHADRTAVESSWRSQWQFRPTSAGPCSGIGRDPASVRQRVEAMEKVLERLFVIPGIKQPVGLDVILDLVPVVGDIAAAAMGTYIVWEAKNLGMSKWQMARMTGNVGLNWLLGLASVVPVMGVIPTLLFRSNTKNLKIIKRHLDKHHAHTALIEGEVVGRQ